MKLQTPRLVIRDFTRADAENVYRIAQEKAILRFMPDWAEGFERPQDYIKYLDGMRRRKPSKDMRVNKRYAVTLRGESARRGSGEMIGMVGMGLKDELGEVEVAYCMEEAHQRRGYTKEALCALMDWIFRKSDIPYLIATVDCANEASQKTALSCGFELYERRTPLHGKMHNMESDSYFYFRLNRPN
jgi:RimJ/RimL family protein N-acetyltransferase